MKTVPPLSQLVDATEKSGPERALRFIDALRPAPPNPPLPMETTVAQRRAMREQQMMQQNFQAQQVSATAMSSFGNFGIASAWNEARTRGFLP